MFSFQKRQLSQTEKQIYKLLEEYTISLVSYCDMLHKQVQEAHRLAPEEIEKAIQITDRCIFVSKRLRRILQDLQR